jgi:hypothetical protein
MPQACSRGQARPGAAAAGHPAQASQPERARAPVRMPPGGAQHRRGMQGMALMRSMEAPPGAQPPQPEPARRQVQVGATMAAPVPTRVLMGTGARLPEGGKRRGEVLSLGRHVEWLHAQAAHPRGKATGDRRNILRRVQCCPFPWGA